MSTRLRRIITNVGLLAASLAFSLVILEILARFLVHVPAHVMRDPYVGRRLTPNVDVVSKGPHWEGHSRINSLGWNAPEFSPKKPEGVYRIVHIGDSQVEGMYVNTDQTFAAQISALLPGVESINMGVGGQGTYPELLTYRYYARTYDPDVTILWFNPGNDFRDNMLATNIELSGSGSMLHIAPEKGGWIKTALLQHLHLPRLIYNHLSGNRLATQSLIRLGLLSMEPEEFQEEIPLSYRTSVIDTPERRKAGEATEKLLIAFGWETREKDVILGLIPSYLDSGPSAEAEFRTLYPAVGTQPIERDFASAFIRRMGEELEIPVIDLTQVFREAYKNGKTPHIPNEGHLSLEGHRIVAEETARLLSEWGYVRRP